MFGHDAGPLVYGIGCIGAVWGLAMSPMRKRRIDFVVLPLIWPICLVLKLGAWSVTSRLLEKEAEEAKKTG